jgi:NAD-dependent SIR2 family protein deacetylase
MVQKRYWARAFVGWSRFSSARPNAAHLALAALEEAGIVRGIITQNVDRLHRAAGSRRVVELHGALAEVVCLDCGELEDRAALQERLSSLNPMFAGVIAEAVPDGDAELSLDRVRGFEIACCLACGGVLKPRVVFFGENVAKPVVDEAFSMLHESEVLLVVGSSLTVFSGYRFVRRAAERAMPVAIVNLGPTRGDAHATVCVDAAAGRVLPTLARALGASGRA